MPETVYGIRPVDAGGDPRVLFTAYRIATQQAGEAMLSLSLVAPDSAQMHEAMAQELERALDTPGAIANLRKAAALDPNLPGIHYQLAEALRQANDQGLRAEAESEYKRALELSPRDARAAAALGDLANQRSDSKAAIYFYRKAFAINPQLPDAAIALAESDANEGDYASAAAKLERVIEADPSNMLVHYRLCNVYRKLGRQEDARRELEAFEHYKKLKERMQSIYNQMRQHVPGKEEMNMPK
jgi:tetratricopeptide (TPR) repeat protein